jgi:hypothetical protein
MLSRSVTGLALALAFAAPALAGDAQPDPHSSSAVAADAHLAAAARLQRIAMPREMALTLINAMIDAISKRMSAEAGPAKAARIEESVRQVMIPAVDGLDSIVASNFARRFTDAQISDYTAFFSQPIYARYLHELPSITTEAAPRILDLDQSEAAPAFERARARVANGTPAAPPPPGPLPDTHTALALSVFDHGTQARHGGLEETLWRSQAGKLADVDDATRQKIHDAFLAEIAPQFSTVRLEIARIYVRHFSDDELKQLDDFFSAPTYRNFMDELDVIVKESQPEFAAWMKANILPNIVKNLQQMKSEGASP